MNSENHPETLFSDSNDVKSMRLIINNNSLNFKKEIRSVTESDQRYNKIIPSNTDIKRFEKLRIMDDSERTEVKFMKNNDLIKNNLIDDFKIRKFENYNQINLNNQKNDELLVEFENNICSFNTAELIEFIKNPLPEGIILKCNLKKENNSVKDKNTVFNLCLEKSGRILLSAKKLQSKLKIKYEFYLRHYSLNEGNSEKIAVLSSNLLGTIYNLYDNGIRIKDTKNVDNVRCFLGTFTFEKKIFGLRKIKFYSPKIDKTTMKHYIFRQSNKYETIHSIYKKTQDPNILKLINKEPKFCEKTNKFQLNFHGRLKIASKKNFQLINENELDSELIYLQFAKIEKNSFICDFQSPLSLIQAFALCISTLQK